MREQTKEGLSVALAVCRVHERLYGGVPAKEDRGQVDKQERSTVASRDSWKGSVGGRAGRDCASAEDLPEKVAPCEKWECACA